ATAATPVLQRLILHELDSMTMPVGVTPQGGGINAPLVRRKRWWTGVAAVAILFVVLAGVGYAVARQRPGLTQNTAQPKPPTPPPAVHVDSVAKRPLVASTPAPAKPP